MTFLQFVNQMNIKFNTSITPNGDKNKYFTTSQLIKRGWTEELIRCYLVSSFDIHSLGEKAYATNSVQKAENFIINYVL